MRKYLVLGLMIVAVVVAGVARVLPNAKSDIVTTTDANGIHISFSHLNGNQRCGAYIVNGGKGGVLKVELGSGKLEVKVLENFRVVYDVSLNGSNSTNENVSFSKNGLCSIELKGTDASGKVDLLFK